MLRMTTPPEFIRRVQAGPADIYPVTGASRPACWPPVAGCLRLLRLQTVAQLAAVHARAPQLHFRLHPSALPCRRRWAT